MGRRRREGVTLTPTEYGSVVLDARAGWCWQPIETGTAVARALPPGVDPAGIPVRLVQVYEVPPARAAADVADLVGAPRATRLPGPGGLG